MGNSIISQVTEEQLKDAVDTSINLTEAMEKIGYVAPRAKNYETFKKVCNSYNININHLLFNKSNPKSHNRYTDEEVFSINPFISQDTVRKRYLKNNYSDYRCSICGINEWNNKKITLRLDHINGIRTDHRLENLRWVCPNCDGQLETYCNNSRIKKHSYCIDCKKEITFGATRCEECNAKNKQKVERPPREELKKLIRTKPFVQIGDMFKVSDNTIRKWCKSKNLPSSKKEIKSYSDDEWDKI